MKNLGVLFCAISLVMMIGIMVVSFTEPAEAGADQYKRIINHVKYYDVWGSYCSNLSYTDRFLTPVVYNGYGHYYNYHIIGNSGHPNGHGSWVSGTYTIYTTYTVSGCYSGG